jgi:ribosomal-protein-alanine N-acetyltransferase
VRVFRPQPGFFKGVLRLLALSDLRELWELDLRIFTDGEAYEADTFRYLLMHPATLARQIRDENGRMCAFAIGVIEEDRIGHVTTIGVSPDHRRHGLARLLMLELEKGFAARGISTMRLEVRASNLAAQRLYEQIGFAVVRRMIRYYSNGDDGYLMIKAIRNSNNSEQNPGIYQRNLHLVR